MKGYGLDVWCDDMGMRTGRYVTGALLVAQALVRRLNTVRGTLRGGAEEAAYGFDVQGFVGAIGYASAVLALPGMVRAQFLKDDRVADATVIPTLTTDTAGRQEITLECSVTLADENETFALTLLASDRAAVRATFDTQEAA